MMSRSESAMSGFPEMRRNYLFTQLAALPAVEVSESSANCFEVFPSEAQFFVGSIALGWNWILQPALEGKSRHAEMNETSFGGRWSRNACWLWYFLIGTQCNTWLLMIILLKSIFSLASFT